VSTPILGRFGDMYGKERMLLLALALFAVGNLIAALAPSLGVMIAGRMVQGAGGAIFPLAIGIVRDEFPPERVAVSIGSISSTFGIGGGAGLVIAGVLVEAIGVDAIFWLSLVVTVVAAWATWRYIPESPVRVAVTKIDVGGATLMSAALAALLLGVAEGNNWGWTSARVLGLFAGSIALALAFAAWERHTPDPLVDLKLMARRPVWTVNASAVAVGFAMFGSYILIPQLVQTDPKQTGYGFGASVLMSGLYLLPSALVMLWSGPLSGRIATTRGSKIPLAIGTVVAGISYLMLALLHHHRGEILISTALLGLGIGLAFAAMANLAVQAVPQDMTGIATGINTIARSVGGAIGAQVAAALLTATTLAGGQPAESGFTAAFLMSAGGAVLALGATLLVPKPGAPGEGGRRVPAVGRLEPHASGVR
jgi:MFS family permease